MGADEFMVQPVQHVMGPCKGSLLGGTIRKRHQAYSSRQALQSVTRAWLPACCYTGWQHYISSPFAGTEEELFQAVQEVRSFTKAAAEAGRLEVVIIGGRSSRRPSCRPGDESVYARRANQMWQKWPKTLGCRLRITATNESTA